MATAYDQFLIPGLAAVSGALNSGKVTQKNKTMTDPAATGLKNQILQGYSGYLGDDVDLTSYQNSQIGNINKLAGLEKQNVEEDLATRGVSGAAASTAVSGVDRNRFANIVKLKQSIPLLQNELRSKKLADASGFLSSLPTDQESETQGPGRLANAGNNFAETLAYLAGKGGDASIAGDLASKVGGILGNVGSKTVNAGGGVTTMHPAGILGGIQKGVSGIGSGISKLATFAASNPILLAGVGAGLAAFVAYKKIGQRRKAANNFNADVHDNFFRNDGQGSVNLLVDGFNKAFDSGQLSKEEATASRDALAEMLDEYLAQADEFSMKGDNQAKVISQNLAQLRNNFGARGVFRLLDDMNSKIKGLAA